MTDRTCAAIDTHVHFWDFRTPPDGMRWDWVEPGGDHPVLGNIDAMKSVTYDIHGLWAEARFANVSGAVHVQAAIGSRDPVLETTWLTAMAAEAPIPMRIVAHADLTGASWPEQLERHAASPLFVGVRDFAIEPVLADGSIPAELHRSLDALAESGLVLDLDCEWPNMPAALSLAREHPALTIVLEHIGFPRRRDDDYFASWAQGIRALASAPNVTCKLSGLGMTDRDFTADSLERWLDTCLSAFGPGRCIVGSNWPLDRVASSYDAIMGVYRDAIAGLSGPEQERILSGNAARIYRFS